MTLDEIILAPKKAQDKIQALQQERDRWVERCQYLSKCLDDLLLRSKNLMEVDHVE